LTIITYCDDYSELLQRASVQPLQFNARTGQGVRCIPGGEILKVDLLSGKLPIPLNRKYRPYVAASECAWILQGDESTEWISKHCSIWNKFAENNQIKKSYGHRIKFQIQKVIQQLKDDPTTRRAVINLWDKNYDHNTSKNAPCPTQMAINFDGNFLNMQIFMRSSDLFVGLPYDVMTWSLILDAIANELNYQPRYLTFFLAHAHIYEDHRVHIPNRGSHCYVIDLPGLSVSSILANMDEYVSYFKKRLQRFEPPRVFDPRPEVFE
tara:strand:+ start:1029 stop:1826 length:798 start_codon:yes stop_codon:yes gene_type:complete